MSSSHFLQGPTAFVALKADFKKETGRDADTEIALFIAYAQAKALLTINQNVGIMSSAVQEIRNAVQQAVAKIK